MRKNKRYSIVIKTGVETRSLKKYSKEEIIKLFSDFEILEMQEIEKDKPTAEGQMKHWHTIEIIAKKYN